MSDHQHNYKRNLLQLQMRDFENGVLLYNSTVLLERKVLSYNLSVLFGRGFHSNEMNMF